MPATFDDGPITGRKIPAEIAAELYELEDGEYTGDEKTHGEWKRLADQLDRTRRWVEHRLLIVTNGGGTFGIAYAVGLTEAQETEWPWEQDGVDELELIPLVGVPVTSTKYLTEKQYGAWLAKGGEGGNVTAEVTP